MSLPVIRRVILVVLDGLRPDAIEAFNLSHIRRLSRQGTATLTGQTVRPSLTWAALTSLLSGVAPASHGIVGDSLRIPRPKTKLDPLPDALMQSGLPSFAFMGQVPALYRGIAGRIARGLGFTEARFAGASAPEVLFAGSAVLRSEREGMMFFHWADADRAGHAHGWMSARYGEAAQQLDSALGMLAGLTDIERDPSTLLIALADHGGGGVRGNHHEEEHPVNATIPIFFAGGSVRRGGCLGDVSLLDVPATIAWALGASLPASYTGRVLHDVFDAGATERAA